ncbi:MAG: prolyl oligopeptidase family serine peptidase [Candidatus Binataceae bacterium]
MSKGSDVSPPPFSRRDNVRESMHGAEVSDPYRWLEDTNSHETRQWLATQREHAARYFASTERANVRGRLAQMMRTDEVGIPLERNGYYFFSRRPAGQQRHLIFRRSGLGGEDEVLVDPKEVSGDPPAGVEISDVTPDGALLVYLVRRGGEDEAEIRVLEIASRRTVDILPRAKQALPFWKHDNSGFYYSLWSGDAGHLRFHRIGTPGPKDRELLTGGHGEFIGESVSDDGRYLLVHVWPGSAGDRTRVYLQVIEPEIPMVTVVEGVDAHSMATMAGDAIIIATNWNAPNYRVMRAELSDLSIDSWREIIAERSACIQGIAAIGGKLVVSYLENAQSQVCIFSPNGDPLAKLDLLAPGSVLGIQGAHDISGVHGRWDSGESFFFFQTFNRPAELYHLNLESGARESWSGEPAKVDPDRFEIHQVWYSSRDGTKVPMFLFHRRGLKLDGSRPTMLYGYGGFKGNITPFFFPPAVLWAEAGGVFASANLRGGGEFGREWHEAGRLERKQNVFDDFIAAAEWLIGTGYTRPSKLAILGGSNGGLLVGAAMTQRPDLFRAVLCVRPLLDMIRYHKFSVASLWVPEYGSADDPDQFGYLIKYSPYHNIRAGVDYPATLFVTGDFDTRVDPMHARKMTAALQAVPGSSKPIILRYGTEAGHSGAAALDTIIDELADETAFLFRELNVPVS